LRTAVLIEKRLLAADDTREFSEMEYYLFLLRYLERKERKRPKRFRQSFKKSVSMLRNQELRKDKTSFCIIDAQSVQNADTAEKRAMTRAKNIRD
jgi:hypothetical protein